MNATTPDQSRKDGIVTAIGVLALLIGSATGNAYAMLAISVAAVGVIAIFYRERVGRTLIVIGLAAMIAVATVITITTMGS